MPEVSRTGLLVASPQMVDVFFSKTVILLCDYNEEGALGIVINRLTGIDSDKVLDQMGVKDGGGIEGPVHWGGPVQPGAVFLTFHRHGRAPSETIDEAIFELSTELGVSPSREVIASISENPDNPGAFLSLGYAGWGAGQLEEEIESGSWIYMDLDPSLVFEIPHDERWNHLIDSFGVDPKMIWMRPVSE